MLLFPEVDEVMPHAVAFARLMIAHAKFEAEVRYLQGAVAGDQAFGEQPCNQWNTRDRPGRMAKLIKDKLGDIEEAQPITDLLKSAVKPTDDRNLLAHGQWWCFQQGTSALTVRRSTIRKGSR